MADVTITGTSPTTYSGPGQTITVHFQIYSVDAYVDGFELVNTTVPLSATTCSPEFPLDHYEVSQCTATYTTTASDVGDLSINGSYKLSTLDAGSLSGDLKAGPATVTYTGPPAPPSISISDVTVEEGNTATFAVNLSSAATPPVSVFWATEDGSATAGADYIANAGTIAFNPGEQTKYISVATLPDASPESNETFHINLSVPTGATIADAQGVGTIEDDDAATPTANPVSATVAANSSDNPITLNITGAQATSVAIASPATHGTAIASGTTITYTPASDYAGTDSFTYTASNDAGTSAPATVTITVADPTLEDFAFSTGFETPLVFSVVNGGVSSYTLAVAPTYGTIVFNADGSGTYTPNRGFSGTDEFQYDAGIYGQNTGTVTITVNPPTITLSPVTLPAAMSGESYSETLSGSGGTGPYTFAHVSGAMVPGLTLAANGTLSGTPTAAGTFSFNVVATDSSGGSGPFSSPPTAVSVTVGQSADATLASLVPSAGSLTPAFASGTQDYDVTVPSSVTSISLTPTTTDANATIIVEGAPVAPGTASSPVALTQGTPTSISVIVTAQDGMTQKTYTVVVTRSASSNADLSSLVPSTGTLFPPFTPNSTGFVVDVPYSVDTIQFTPTAADPDATIHVNASAVTSGSPTSPIALTAGTGTPVTILVTAPDSTYKPYTIVVNRAAADATLSSLVPSAGNLDPAFASGILSYNMTIANSVDSITFTPTATDATSTITVNGAVISSGGTSSAITLPVGATNVTVEVTAPDGTTKKTYTVTVTREASAKADLASLAPSAGTLSPAFDAATLAYNLAVGNGVDSVTFTPTVAEANATMTVNGTAVTSGSQSQPIALAVGSTAVNVVVTAQDGTTKKTYTVTVTRAGATNATLSGLVPSKGTLDPTFSATTLGYNVSVDNTVDSIQITPTAADPTAMITVNGTAVASGSASGVIALPVGTTQISVVVTAQDATTKKTYTVTVTREASATPDLASLVPSAGTLSPAFDAATLAYNLAVDNSVDSVTFTPTAADTTATITVNGTAVISGSQSQPIALAVGSTAVNVVVTAQDGTTKKTYTVTVIRAGSTNAALSSLVPSVGSLSPAFSSATLAYSVSVDNTVDSIQITPTVADTTATITVNGAAVASGSASAAIALPVGTTQIPVVVTAQDGTTKQTYTVSVVRAASVIADLSGLVPSAGSLDPAFAASTYSYSVTVANSIETITFTPTVLDAAATITVSGSSVSSGAASPDISVAVGTTNVSIIVTAQDGTTTKTYTVSVVRSKPLPTAASRTIEVVAGAIATVDLTEGATGSPFTVAGLTSVPGSNAGTARLNAGNQQLTFDASPTFSGSAKVSYTLTNAAGTSAPATITFAVIARPDPSKDPEVIGLLRAQVDAAKRFAQYQTRNFNNRLEQLHDEGDRRRNSMDIRLGYRESDSNDDSNRTDAERRLEQMGDTGTPGLLGYADGKGAPYDTGNPSSGSGIQGPDFGAYAVWAGGFVDFAERDKGGLDIDSTAVGISTGIDYRFSPRFVAGFGGGYGRDKSDVGDNGTESRAHAYSAAVYGSYKPADHLFIDGLIGGSWLSYDSRRYVTANGDFADGQRDGKQLFGSLTAAYEFRDQKWLVSPYGRFELSRSWLDGFTEKGGGIYGLTYGDQTVDTVSGVIGIRASYDIRMDWGKLTPGVRAEFTHDFAGSSRINLGYMDIGTLPYTLDIDSVGSDYATLGLSLDAAFLNDWMLGFEYRTAFGSGRQDHAVGLKVGAKF